MPDALWQTCPLGLADDEALGRAVLEAHEGILRGQLAGDPMLNRNLAIQLRAQRRVEDWRVLLLLAPWMLARLLFPDEPPDLEIPVGWTADERRGADYQVLGPSLSFELLGQPQRAHLNYHTALGHYLLQPICLDMRPYRDSESVFEAWNQVIRIRDENMEKAKRDCPLQKEVSRRELFRRIGGSSDGER
jgi:hypothetical protein